MHTRKLRGKKQWVIDAHIEHQAGLLPKRIVRFDEYRRTFTSASAARAHLTVLADALRDGKQGDTSTTFEDAFEAWRDAVQEKIDLGSIAQATADDDIRLVQNHVLETITLRSVPIGKVRLINIDHSLLRNELVRSRVVAGQRVLGQLLQSDLSRPSIVKLTQKIRAIFEAARAEGWITTNPADGLTIPLPTVDAADKAIDPEIFGEFSGNTPEIFEALAIIAPQFVLPLQILRQTGIRVGELRALTLDQIDVSAETTHIRIDRAWKNCDSGIGKPKNGLTRQAVVSLETGRAILAHALASGRRGKDLLFGDRGNPLHEATLRLVWHQAQFAVRGWLFCRSSNTRSSGRSYHLARLPRSISDLTTAEFAKFRYGRSGLKRGTERDSIAVGTVAEAAAHINLTLFGLHDLRHLYASKLFAAGIPVRQVAQRIGDTEKTTERHYVHFLPHESADDLEAIAAIQ